MPTPADINEPLIRENIHRAVADVFLTMLQKTPDFSAEMPLGEGQAVARKEGYRPQVVGAVGFIGDISGLIYLHFDVGFSRICAAQMLGMEIEEVEKDGEEYVNDAIGELTNMTVGAFKNGLSDSGFSCKLTIPSILRGSNFSIEPIEEATRHVYYFTCGEHRVVADILLKNDDEE